MKMRFQVPGFLALAAAMCVAAEEVAVNFNASTFVDSVVEISRLKAEDAILEGREKLSAIRMNLTKDQRSQVAAELDKRIKLLTAEYDELPKRLEEIVSGQKVLDDPTAALVKKLTQRRTELRGKWRALQREAQQIEAAN